MSSNQLLFAVVLVLANQLVAGNPGDQLKSLCANQKIELARASQLRGLVDALGSVSDCPPRIQSALVELDQLMNQENGNVCLANKIDQTRAYYKKYVDKRSIDGQHEQKLPKSLRNLFLSYGFRVNRLCKSNMTASLLAHSSEFLTERDFEQITKWTSDASPLARMLKTPKDVDDLVLPKEIVGLMYEWTKKKGQQLSRADVEQSTVFVVLEPATGRMLRRVQVVCNRRFRPIYEQFILPLVSMSRIGLSFKGSELEDHVNQIKANNDVHQWHRIVFMCESLANIRIFEDLKGTLRINKSSVRVLVNEEADELRASQQIGELSVDEEDIGEQLSFQIDDQHRLGDVMVDKQVDKSIAKLVAKFDAHKSDMRRIRWKVARQVVAFMKEAFKSGRLNIVKQQRKGKETKINEQLIDTIDRHASDTSLDSDEQSGEVQSSSGAHLRVKRFVSVVAVVFMAIGGIAVAIVIVLFALYACIYLLTDK